MNALGGLTSDLRAEPASAFCSDCAHACETHCARITPGLGFRWQAFERVGLAAQHPPGARRNAAYMAWISREWATWREMHGHTSRSQSEAVHAAFDRWLAARHDVPANPREGEG